jgi:predicted nucleotidyltransferase
MILKPEQSQKIVERLRRELDPVSIYLFGSQATERATEEDSDVDLCVVVPDDEEHTFKKASRAYRSLRDLQLPKDIIVCHKSRFEKRSTWLNSLERHIAECGTILFSR